MKACAPEPMQDGLDPEAELAQLARALSHPARVRIVRFLQEQETCIAGEIAEMMPLAPSTVSQHLKQLKAAGLIRGEIDGPRRCYCVNEPVLARLKHLIADL